MKTRGFGASTANEGFKRHAQTQDADDKPFLSISSEPVVIGQERSSFRIAEQLLSTKVS